MIRIDIKALSINEAYKGRKFSTPALAQYKKDLYALLPKKLKVPEGKLSVRFFFGFSSKSADGDNAIKAFQDALGEYYGFNDKRIYEWHVKKVDVKKGKEYISFELSPLDFQDRI